MDKNYIKRAQKELVMAGLLWLSLPSFIILISILLISPESKVIKIGLYASLGVVIIVSNIKILRKARKFANEYNAEADETKIKGDDSR